MSSKRRRFTRSTGKYRDARLIVIVAEGAKTEKFYFEAIQTLLNSSRIQIELIEREDITQSAPKYVMQELDKFKEKYNLDEDDELWLVCDVDHWTKKELALVSKECKQKDYSLAISNPCFEFWLYLHLVSWEEITEKEKNLFLENPRLSQHKKYLDQKIANRMEGYTHSSQRIIYKIAENYKKAITEEKKIERNRNSRFPDTLGSDISNLLERLLEYSKDIE